MSTSFFRSKGCSPGPAVSLAVSPTQLWEPRGVPLGTGTIVPRVCGHGVHRDEESPPRGRRSAFSVAPREQCYSVMDVLELRRLVLGRETQVQDTAGHQSPRLCRTWSRPVSACELARDRNLCIRATLRAEMPSSGFVVMATGGRLLRKSSRRRLRVFLRPRCKQQPLLPRQPRTHLSRWTLRSSRRRSGRGSPSSARSSPSSRLETLEKEMLPRPRESKPTSQRLKLAQDAWDKAARKPG